MKKICVVTGSRAEYGLLYWLMKEIQSDPELQLQIIATGMHLSPDFGETYRVIEKDGFKIDEKVEVMPTTDSAAGVSRSVGQGVIGFTDAFQRLKPDWVVLLGDRYEIFAAAQAAMLTGIPIAHLHGGEATEGLIDEPIRHSITKMAHLHFVAAEPYRRRVIQLGEQPDRVFNFGAPGIETIRRMRLLERAELEHALDFKLDSPFFLVTYHPVTFASIPVTETLDQLFMALEKFPTAHILITKSNADAGGREVNKRLDDFGARNPDRIKVATSLGMLNYLSALRHCDVVIGNSSSGLIEAPSFKKPTVNLGDRQRGRLKAESVIDCEEKTSAIEAAIWKALSPEFRKCCETIVSPYGQGDVALGVKNTLKSFDTAGILMKRFFDFPVGEFK